MWYTFWIFQIWYVQLGSLCKYAQIWKPLKSRILLARRVSDKVYLNCKFYWSVKKYDDKQFVRDSTLPLEWNIGSFLCKLALPFWVSTTSMLELSTTVVVRSSCLQINSVMFPFPLQLTKGDLSSWLCPLSSGWSHSDGKTEVFTVFSFRTDKGLLRLPHPPRELQLSVNCLGEEVS